MLAAIALEIQVANNVFSRDQAQRVTHLLLSMVKDSQPPECLNEACEYLKLVGEANLLSVNPAMQVAQRLLAVWLGQAISHFPNGGLDPTLITFTATALACFVGYSKRAKEHYRIVQG
jgi:hypothetical protein